MKIIPYLEEILTPPTLSSFPKNFELFRYKALTNTEKVLTNNHKSLFYGNGVDFGTE
jgi:hypothetical protein